MATSHPAAGSGTSKFVVGCQPKTNDEMADFFAKVEREHAEKGKELKNYLAVCADHSGRKMNALTVISCRGEGIEEGALRLLGTMVLSNIVRGQTTLKNGKGKGDWSNGSMGSRWWDWEQDGVSCRVAFFSKKFSDKWTRDKPYALVLTFEKE